MISLRDIFKRYTGTLRGMKWVYVLNNLLNSRKLDYTRRQYKKYGVKKSALSPVGSHEFPQDLGEPAWLDQPDALEKLSQHPDFQKFSPAVQAAIRHFVEKGFLVLRGFYSPEEAAGMNAEVERLLREKRTGFNYTGKKIMDAWRFSPLTEKGFFKNPRLLDVLSFIMGRPVLPFQTIHFLEGSEQRAHSDSIHMTTEPPGFLIASWTALEPCDMGCGPLFYYPGSHRLPYLMCPDYDSGNTNWRLGERSYKNYEDAVEALIQNQGLKKEYFLAQTGDVLLWHANLLHGGSPITRPGATRRSMVSHYFCEGVICYHEISQRPALMENRAGS